MTHPAGIPYRADVFDTSEELKDHWGMNDLLLKTELEDEVLAGQRLGALLGVDDFWRDAFEPNRNEEGELTKESFEEMTRLIITNWVERNRFAEIISVATSELLLRFGTYIPSTEVDSLTLSIQSYIYNSLCFFTSSCFRLFDTNRSGYDRRFISRTYPTLTSYHVQGYLQERVCTGSFNFFTSRGLLAL